MPALLVRPHNVTVDTDSARSLATPINVCMNNNAIALQRYSLQSIDPQILHRSSDLVTIRILAIKISDAVDLLS